MSSDVQYLPQAMRECAQLRQQWLLMGLLLHSKYRSRVLPLCKSCYSPAELAFTCSFFNTLYKILVDDMAEHDTVDIDKLAQWPELSENKPINGYSSFIDNQTQDNPDIQPAKLAQELKECLAATLSYVSDAVVEDYNNGDIEHAYTLNTYLNILLEDYIIRPRYRLPRKVMTDETMDKLLEDDKYAAEGALQSGYSKFDQLLGGGLRVGEVCTIIGPTGIGKTSFAFNLAMRYAIDVGVIYITCENTRHSLADKRSQIIQANPALKASTKLCVHDIIDPSFHAIKTIIHDILINPEPYPIEIIFIDYVQMINNHGYGKMTRNDVLCQMSRAFKNIALGSQVIIFFISQINKLSRDKVTLASVKDSMGIAEVSDFVLSIECPRLMDEQTASLDLSQIARKERMEEFSKPLLFQVSLIKNRRSRGTVDHAVTFTSGGHSPDGTRLCTFNEYENSKQKAS